MCLEKPFHTSTAEILSGLIKGSTSEKCKCTLAMAKDSERRGGRNSTHPVLGFHPAKEAKVTNGPRNIVCTTPLPSSVSRITVPKDAMVSLRTLIFHHLEPKFHEANRERERVLPRTFLPCESQTGCHLHAVETMVMNDMFIWLCRTHKCSSSDSMVLCLGARLPFKCCMGTTAPV